MGLFSSSVIQLKPSDFNKNLFIKTKELDGSTLGLVIFFVPWCSYCQKVAPIYSKIADILPNTFPIYGFDCEKYQEFCTRLPVQSYPTIMYINKDGSLGQLYKGERTIDGFLSSICKVSSKCI